MQASPAHPRDRYDPGVSAQGTITVAVGRFDDLIARGLRALIDDDEQLELVAEDVATVQLPTLLRGRRPNVAIVDAASLRSPAEVRTLSTRHSATHLLLLAERPIERRVRTAARVRGRRLPGEVDAVARRSERDPPRLARAAADAARRPRARTRVGAADGARGRRAERPAAAPLERADRRGAARQRRDGAHARAPHLPQARRLLAPRAARAEHARRRRPPAALDSSRGERAVSARRSSGRRRLLRLDRAGTASGAARPAGRGRRERPPRGRHDRQLRGAALRRRLGDARRPRAAAVPAGRVPAARLHDLPRRLSADDGDRPQPGRARRGRRPRRGLPRPLRAVLAARGDAPAGRRDLDAGGAHLLGRDRPQQARREGRLRRGEARRASSC